MRLKQERSSGITTAHIRTWALVCIAVGMAGVVLQNVLGDVSTKAAAVATLTDEKTGILQGVALICIGVYSCAVPLFALLLVEGAIHTRDLSKYLIRVGAVALISEVPFDLATRGAVLDTTTLNPAFGAVLALVMLMFFQRYPDNSAGSVILRVIITVAMVFWSVYILPIEEGPCLVLITSALWNFRENPKLRLVAGIVVGAACGLIKIFYVATPLAMLLVHFYNGEKGNDFKAGRLVAYPGILLLAVLASYVF